MKCYQSVQDYLCVLDAQIAPQEEASDSEGRRQLRSPRRTFNRPKNTFVRNVHTPSDRLIHEDDSAEENQAIPSSFLSRSFGSEIKRSALKKNRSEQLFHSSDEDYHKKHISQSKEFKSDEEEEFGSGLFDSSTNKDFHEKADTKTHVASHSSRSFQNCFISSSEGKDEEDIENDSEVSETDGVLQNPKDSEKSSPLMIRNQPVLKFQMQAKVSNQLVPQRLSQSLSSKCISSSVAKHCNC